MPAPYTCHVLDFGTLPTRPPSTATVVFDGHCGFCTRSVDWLEKLDRHDRLTCVASQRSGVRSEFEISDEEAEDSAWTIGPDGERAGGARAIALAVAVATGNRFTYIPWKIPGGTWAMGKTYRFIADHRGRLPGTTPWCEQHPDECATKASKSDAASGGGAS